MPPPPSLPHEDLQKIILTADGVVDDSGNVAPLSAPVWKSLEEKVGIKKITHKYLFQYVSGNRANSLDNLLQHLGVERKESNCTSDSSPDSPEAPSTDYEENYDDPDTKVLKPQATFRVHIPAEEWSKIKPVSKEFFRKDRGTKRTRLVMPPFEYGSMLIKLVWDQHKLPCPYTFVRSYVSTGPDRQQFVLIEANCRECGAEAIGRILSEPIDGEDVVMLWRANDTRKNPHKLRRPLQGEEREHVARLLEHDSCARYRRELREKNKDPGDPEPPFLWSGDVLSHAKIAALFKRLGIEKQVDPIRGLMTMKRNEPFAGSIHGIGADEFFVHYFSPMQMEIYRRYRSSSYVSLSIDATGSVVDSIARPYGKSPAIFLYEGVIHTGGTQLSVAQMLSEKQDAVAILHWLSEWERCGAKAPQEVVVDNSSALKLALAKTLCRCKDFADLRDRTFSFLTGMSPELPSPCYLRLDVAHIMSSAKKWNLWSESSLKRLKQFYLSCLGLLVKATSLEEFKIILKHIFVVALSPGRTAEDSDGCTEDSLRYLRKQIEGQPHIAESSDPEEDTRHPETKQDAEESCSIREWLADLRSGVESLVGEADDLYDVSAFYSPKIADEFQSLCRDFPFWSAVLVDAYKSPFLTASSAPVESDFKVLKHDILTGRKKRQRADVFVAQHLQSIAGQCLAVDSEQDKEVVRAGELRMMQRKAHRRTQLDSEQEEKVVRVGEVRTTERKGHRRTPSDSEQEEKVGRAWEVRTTERKEHRRTPSDSEQEEQVVRAGEVCTTERKGHRRTPSDSEQEEKMPPDSEQEEQVMRAGDSRITERKHHHRTPSDSKQDERVVRAGEVRTTERKEHRRTPSDSEQEEQVVRAGEVCTTERKGHRRTPSDSEQEEKVGRAGEVRTTAKKGHRRTPPDSEQEEVVVRAGESRITDRKQHRRTPSPERTQSIEEEMMPLRRSLKKEECSSEDDNAHNLNTYENWGGLGGVSNARRRKKKSYLDANPELDVAVESKETSAPKKVLLKNGNLFLRPVVISPTSSALVTNTCPFDSLAQVLCAAYIDREDFRAAVNTQEENDAFLHTVRSLAVKGAVKDTYESRAKAVAQVQDPIGVLPEPSQRTTRGRPRKSVVCVRYDCFTNASSLASKLLKSTPSAQVQLVCQAENCTWEEWRAQVVLEVNWKHMISNGIGHLEKAVNETLEMPHWRCGDCREVCKVGHIKFGPHLLVNVDFIADPAAARAAKVPQGTTSKNIRPYALGEVPRTVRISSTLWKLAGVVAYTDKHYVGYALRRGGEWKLYNDLSSKVSDTIDDQRMKPHLFVYTT